MFSLLVLLLSMDVELTVTVNSPSIRQCDPLIVKASVENRGRDLLAIKDRDPACDNRVRYEYRPVGREEWVALPTMSRLGTFSGLPSGYETDEIVLWEKDIWPEYDVVLLDDKDEFVFARPGRFELRAVVETATTKRPIEATGSQPVVVTVEPRPAKDRERIENSRKIVHKACGSRWQRTIPKELRELHDVGGSLGPNVANLLLIERITNGEQHVGYDAFEFLQERLSGIDLEIGLLRLGDYYRQRQDRKRLAQIISGLRHRTLLSIEWDYFVELKPRRGYDPNKYQPEGE
jgi:hypothetical protein